MSTEDGGPPAPDETSTSRPRENAILNNYYCHECQREFRQRLTPSNSPACTYCGSSFCELLGPVNQPRRSAVNRLMEVPAGANSTSSTSVVPGLPGVNFHHQTVSDPNTPNVQSHMVTIAMNADELAAGGGTADMANRIMQQLRNVIPSTLPAGTMNAHIHAPNGQPIQIQNPFQLLNSATAGAGIGSNPANFAWGVHGMEQILNRLMEEAGNDGSARPCPEETIAAINSYPLTTPQVNALKDANSCECSICMSEFHVDTIVKKLPPCNHIFHCDCIDAWLRLHNSCPVCRTEVKLPEDEPDGQADDAEDAPHEPGLSYFS